MTTTQPQRYRPIRVTPLGGNHPQDYAYTPLPDECPVCHAKGTPSANGGVHTADGIDAKLYIAFQCPAYSCGAMFVGEYDKSQGGNVFQIRSVKPRTPQSRNFPECIENLSPEFVRIYNQAIAAEAYELDGLTGIGLRKALEFLVKDFAKAENPGKEQEIENAFLGNCIKDYIQDPNTKECAKRAVSLGNDETHYVRKWGDKDIKDLKLLVHLTVSWIDSLLLTRQYQLEMPA